MDTKMKGKPLTRDETKSLIDLIEKSKIIMTKTTNASNNKLKEEEWNQITNTFNATVYLSQPRTAQQLRLKWENLKKNARRRSSSIRMNNIKTGGGKGDYIPPDENLDRVIGLLGTTASGLMTSCGGDRGEDMVEEEGCSVSPQDITNPEAADISAPLQETLGQIQIQNGDSNAKPDPSRRFSVPKKGKRKFQGESMSARDMAVTDYYKLKKQCLEAKFNNIILENKKLRLENEKLLLELENLKKS